MTDETFLRLNVIGDLVRLITVLTVLEDRFAFPFKVKRVPYAMRVDQAAVNIHADKIGGQLHRLVFEFTLTVQVRCTVTHHDHRVTRLVMYRRLQITLLLRHHLHGVQRQTICHQTISHNR